jgi:uncharacterized protein YbaA (DUF1428 family)
MTTKKSAKYMEGFVFVVPKKNIAAYKKMAREGAAAWKKFGALDYKECMGNDLVSKGPDGKPNPMNFIKLTNAKPTETVWFSFITYKNKIHRDQVNKKVMKFFSDKYANMKDFSMPFDMSRMATGGFQVEVD